MKPLQWGIPLLSAVLLTQPGCFTLSTVLGQKRSPQLDTSLLEAQGYSVPPGGMPMAVAPSSSGPRVVLEVRGEERHMESIPLPAEGGLFIQDLVQQAKLHEQLGRLQISIMRPNGPEAPPVRMDLRTDDDGKVTHMGQNYALRPDDHIVVIYDQRTHLERFLDKTMKFQ